MIVEKLMGNAYKHYYTSRVFKNNYEKFRKKAQVGLRLYIVLSIKLPP